MGGEFRLNSWTDRNSRGAQGILNFSGNETGNPFNNTGTFTANGVSGSVGNAYASFLLGQIDTASVNTVQDPQLRKTAWGLYITDTWKVTSQADSRLRRALGLRKLGSRNSPPLGRVRTEHPQSHCQQHSRRPDLRGQWSRPLQLPLHQHLSRTRSVRGWALLTRSIPRPCSAGASASTTRPIPSFAYITNAALLGVGFNQLTFNNPGGAFGVPAATLNNGLVYDRSLLTTASLNPGLFPASPTVLGNPNFYTDPQRRPARPDSRVEHRVAAGSDSGSHRGSQLRRQSRRMGEQQRSSGRPEHTEPVDLRQVWNRSHHRGGPGDAHIHAWAARSEKPPEYRFPYPTFPTTSTVLPGAAPLPAGQRVRYR